jgi:dTDP-4-amino-4,6-dideoxygalactose transaminase
MIPFVDLTAQYKSIKNEIDDAISNCIANTNFIKGNAVAEFEKAFAGYLNMNYCIGCGNGTDALEIILKALHIGIGDEVIVPALTWISTAEAVTNVGAEPIFADIDPGTYTIDPSRIEEKITKRTKAIIPVHLYGCPADMDQIGLIAGKFNLKVVEDCAQAHGAEFKGRKVGSFGIASAFSFFPSKNLGAFGDAGAIVTNDKELSELVRKISDHGQLGEKHKHVIAGRNSRLDSLQASILHVKLNYLNQWNRRRQEVASQYISKLSSRKEFVLPVTDPEKNHVFHLFVIRSDNRNKLIKLLDENEISWGIHYPNALPFTDAYSYKKHIPEDFPVASSVIRNIISIPIYPELTSEQINLICSQLLKYHE